jgi:colanic acid biosynthesis glycosyl transferase WcaI
MKICFVNRFFYPDQSATSQLLTDLAFHLANAGHEVTVVCSPLLYEDPKARLPEEERINQVRIVRVATTRFGRRTLAGRLLDYLSFYLTACWQVARIVSKDVVLVIKTDPPLLSVPLTWIARRRGARVVNWLQDVFPEVGADLGLAALRGPVLNLLVGLRNHALERASCNVAIGDRMAARLSASGTRTAFTIIPNWSDIEAPASNQQQAQVRQLRADWGLEQQFVVMYSGNMGRAHEFETILGAAVLLRDEPGITFVFVGGGAQRDHLLKQASDRGLSNVRFKPYQARETLSISLSAGDVHLISLNPELEGLIVPSKVYGVLAVGRPTVFIGDQDGEVASLLRAHDCGATVMPGQAAQLAELLRKWSAEPAHCAKLGAQAVEAHKMHYVASRAMQKWTQTLTSVT